MTKDEIEILKEWEFILRNISDFVQVGRIKDIKFIIKTNENAGHNKPHLHVETSSASMSIAIEDFEILAKSGRFSPVQIRKAKEWMSKNKSLITKEWNEFSNGYLLLLDSKA